MRTVLARLRVQRAARGVELALAALLVASAGVGFVQLNRPLPEKERVVTDAIPDGGRILDARGPLAYRQGHLPGAHQLYARELLSFEGAGAGGLAPAEALADAVRGLGLAPGEEVVVYDDSGDAGDAALVTLVLHAFGIEARMLRGGFDAWRAAGGEPSQEAPPAPEASDAALEFDERLLAGANEAREHLDEGAVAPLDVRPRAAYDQGHLEGAVQLAADALLPDGELPRASELAARLGPMRLTRDTHPFVYGEDVRQAARAYLALRAYDIPHLHVHRGSYATLEGAGLPTSRTANPRATSEESSSICWE